MTDEKWVSATVPGVEARFLMRNEFRDGRWVTTGLFVEAEEVIARKLRRPPLLAAGVALSTDPEIAASATSGGVLSALLSDLLRSAPAVVETSPPARQKLWRPNRRDPDGHSRAVAAAYQEAVRAGKNPGPALAEEAGVPVCTVYGWIKQARLRGHLPPGQRGRAG